MWKNDSLKLEKIPFMENYGFTLIRGNYATSGQKCKFIYDTINQFYNDPILPEDLLETVSRVVTPRVVLPATESTSIQNETQEITTIRMVGK